MEFKITEDISNIIDEKKKIIYTLISNSITNFLNEVSIKGTFSNADLLLMIDDIYDNLKSIIASQISQISFEGEESKRNLINCKKEILLKLDEMLDLKKEKNALKITKQSFLTENSVYKSITTLEKDAKSVSSKIMFQLSQCLSLN